MRVKKYAKQKPVSHIPPDSATYLEGSLPGYQGDDTMNVGGESVKMNDLSNPFNPDEAESGGDDSLPAYMTPATRGPPSPETPQPPLWPAGDYAGEFVAPSIPDGLFMIKYDGQSDRIDGPYDGSTFIIDPETNIAYSANYPGSPLFIRATSQDGGHLDVIYGDGTVGTMDIIPQDDYEPDNADVED